jgi:hypothetical protein
VGIILLIWRISGVIDTAGVFTVHRRISVRGILNYRLGFSVIGRGITLLLFSR